MTMQQPSNQLQVATPELTNAQMEVLKKTLCKDATNEELQLFAQVCGSRGLSPFAGQIYMIKRGGRPTFQTGIDGYRALAARTGQYAGNDEPIFYPEDAAERPSRATVTVYRVIGGARIAFSATVRWNEFADPSNQQWKSRPFHMLAKCAEAQALRKAFPAEVGGIHTDDEMAGVQADPVAAAPATAADLNKRAAAAPAPAPAASVVEGEVVPEQPAASQDVVKGSPLSSARQKRIEAAVKGFAPFGIKPEQICAKVGVKTLDEITDAHLNEPLALWWDELKQAQEAAEGT